MNNQEEVIKKNIVKILNDHKEGLTITDFSKILNIHRQTIARHISFLEGAGIVYIRRIGPVKLCYLSKFKDWKRLEK